MTSAQLGDVTIEYEVDGPDDGEPMLLVMGLGAQLVAWPTDVVERPRGARLPRHPDGQPRHRAVDEDRGSGAEPGCALQGLRAPAVRAVRLPARRHGRATPWRCSTTSSVDAAHVVGVSMGGMIAQQLTIDHPERVLSLCSIMSNTGDRRHGSVSPRLLPPWSRSRCRPRGRRPRRGRAARRRGVPTDRRAALRRRRDRRHGAHRPSAATSTRWARSASSLAIQASPDRTAELRRGAGADPRHPRPARPARAAERRHRDGPGGAGGAAGRFPRHGARPARAAPGRDRRGDRPQRGAGRAGSSSGSAEDLQRADSV